jgi:O-methyltransferase
MRNLGRKILAFFRRPSRMRYKLISIFGGLVSFDRREEILFDAMRFVKHSKLGGDYLEFGVWKGGSISVAYHLRQLMDLPKMRLFGFDSFEGLPKIEGVDKNTGEFSKGDYNAALSLVQHNLQKNGVELRQITFVKGWYNDTLNEETRRSYDIQKVAIAYIDCDLYESTVPVLEFLTPLLQEGTVLIFDDWFCHRASPDLGEQKACAEWQKKHRINLTPYHMFGWAGNSFIVHV